MPPSPRVRAGDVLDFDALVIGSGVAGLVTALDLIEAAPHLSVAVIDKGQIGTSGSTPLAQGGMAAAVGSGDSPGLHAADTIRAGDGLCDREAVNALATEGAARVGDLVARGARFDREPMGGFALAREGGQSVPRSVRAADATGAEIFRALRDTATGRVVRLQGIACALAGGAGDAGASAAPVTGAWVLLDPLEASSAGPEQEGGLVLVRAGAVVIASGGCGGLYAATTNRDAATGDGVALAWGAGAALVDLEFVQFHPTGLKVSSGAEAGFWRLLLTEALRGAGAVLVDSDGHRFMPAIHPDAELAPRHIVTKAILDQPGGVLLDASHLGGEVLAEEFPTVLAGAKRFGFDLTREPVPVEPCQHYMIGGVATDLQGRTSVGGLYAVGEVACTGVHGANRMAGNSLTQSCVFAHRAARTIRTELEASGARRRMAETTPPPLHTGSVAVDLEERRADLRRAMSHGAGPIRSAASLDAASKVIRAIEEDLPVTPIASRPGIELTNLLTLGRLIIRSARLRTESRGAHWREDAPVRSALWNGVRLRVSASQDASADGGQPSTPKHRPSNL